MRDLDINDLICKRHYMYDKYLLTVSLCKYILLREFLILWTFRFRYNAFIMTRVKGHLNQIYHFGSGCFICCFCRVSWQVKLYLRPLLKFHRVITFWKFAACIICYEMYNLTSTFRGSLLKGLWLSELYSMSLFQEMNDKKNSRERSSSTVACGRLCFSWFAKIIYKYLDPLKMKNPHQF